jgi:hypothetical protein
MIATIGSAKSTIAAFFSLSILIAMASNTFQKDSSTHYIHALGREQPLCRVEMIDKYSGYCRIAVFGLCSALELGLF